VRIYGYQILKAIAFCHRIKLIHTDLKPENVLLVKSDHKIITKDGVKDHRIPISNEIRLIDFGGATFEHEHHSKIINTRQYRSPEVLLGLGWSYPSDLWSIGCILAELFTGDLLFRTHEDLEHLALMERILGAPLPPALTLKALEPFRNTQKDGLSDPKEKTYESRSPKRSKSKKKKRARSSSNPQPDELLSFADGKLKWPGKASSRQSIKHVQKTKTLEETIPDRDFVDLLRKLLDYDAKKRITAKEALAHPFFKICREEEERQNLKTSVRARTTSSSISQSLSISQSRSRSRRKRGRS